MIEIPISADSAKRVMKGYRAWIVYAARRRRIVHPYAWFDSAGRWYPTEKEYQDCCCQIRSPSRNWPYSLMLHCRTAKHIAQIFSVGQKEVRSQASALTNLGEPKLAVEAEEALRSVGVPAER